MAERPKDREGVRGDSDGCRTRMKMKSGRRGRRRRSSAAPTEQNGGKLLVCSLEKASPRLVLLAGGKALGLSPTRDGPLAGRRPDSASHAEERRAERVGGAVPVT